MDTDHMVIAFYYVLIDLARLNIGKLVGISDKFPDAVFRLILNTGKEMAIAVNTGQIPCIVYEKDRSVDHPAQKRQRHSSGKWFPPLPHPASGLPLTRLRRNRWNRKIRYVHLSEAVHRFL